MSKKITIYQVLPRLFGNRNTTHVEFGTVAENGCGKFSNFDVKTLHRIHAMGFTHVWFTGVIRHATQTDYSSHGIPVQHTDIVKGRAGSPYAITDYYDVDPDLADDVDDRMGEWQSLIKRTHKEGMKVIMDFVPNHVAREYHSVCKPKGVQDLGEGDDAEKHFSTDNNFYYCWGQPLDLSDIVSTTDYTENPARATGNDNFSNRPSRNDWYETVKLNYGIDYCDAGGRSEHFDPVPDTWKKMTDILLFWASKRVDGFRCDMAEMVPAAFWAYATKKVKERYPRIIFIGEVYDINQYRTYIASGFDYLYDKVGMYDCLRSVMRGETPAYKITQQWQTVDDIRSHMLYFLENHDEQRIASDFFAQDARKGIPAAIVSAFFGTNPFMLYSGQEFGEKGMDKEGFSGVDGRTTIFDYWAPDTLSRAYADKRLLSQDERHLASMYKTLLTLAIREKAVSDGVTFDLMYVNPDSADLDPHRQFAFMRKKDNDTLLVVVNFAGHQVNVKVAIPSHAFEFLNIPEKKYVMTDLLTGDTKKVELVKDEKVAMTVKPYSGRIYKFSTR